MSFLFNVLGTSTCRRIAPLGFMTQQRMFFATKGSSVSSQIFNDPNKNRYQESQMLFFGNKNRPASKAAASRPKTIAEIKAAYGVAARTPELQATFRAMYGVDVLKTIPTLLPFSSKAST